MSSATLTIIIIVAVIAVAALAVAGLQLARRKRTEQLRDRFGPEYERAVHDSDNQREAEAGLRERVKRQKKLDLRPLDAGERADFEHRWQQVQAAFVDDPSRAVRDADHLVVEVMAARGYPVEDFDQRAEDLSVEHPKVTQSYRKARGIARSNEDGSADTEDLRSAVTSYRELVEALLTDNASTDRDRTDRDGADRGRRNEVPAAGTGDDRGAHARGDEHRGDEHATERGAGQVRTGQETSGHRDRADDNRTDNRTDNRKDDKRTDARTDADGQGDTVNGAAHSLTTPSSRRES